MRDKVKSGTVESKIMKRLHSIMQEQVTKDDVFEKKWCCDNYRYVNGNTPKDIHEKTLLRRLSNVKL